MLTLFLLTVLIYHRCFRRYDADPEPELGLPAKRLTFLSGPNRLQGYLCGTGGHARPSSRQGLGTERFPMRRRSNGSPKPGCACFHLTTPAATAARAGRAGGFPQAADDLRAALRFLEENGRFGSRRLVLLGHSMGGYAVCCALPGSRVDAAVCIGGVNSPMEATLSPVLHHIGRACLCALSGAVPLSGRALRTARPAPHRRTGCRRVRDAAAARRRRARLDRSAAPQLHSGPSARAAAGAGPALGRARSTTATPTCCSARPAARPTPPSWHRSPASSAPKKSTK